MAHALQPPLHDLQLRLLRVVQQRPDLVLALVRQRRSVAPVLRQLVPVLVVEREPGGGVLTDPVAATRPQLRGAHALDHRPVHTRAAHHGVHVEPASVRPVNRAPPGLLRIVVGMHP